MVLDYELFNVQDQKILKICTYEKWEVFFDKYWIFIDAIIYSFLPFILLTSLNTLIFISIKKWGKRILKYKFKNSLDVKTLNYNPAKSRSKLISFNSSYSLSTGRKSTRFSLIETLNEFRVRTSSIDKNACEMISEQRKYIEKKTLLLILMISISFFTLTIPIVILQIIHKLFSANNNDQYFNILKFFAFKS